MAQAVGSRLSTFDRRDESVAPPRQRFDKARTFRRIAQHLANLVDGCVQIVIDIDESVRPQPLLQFVPGHNLAGGLQQDGQNLKRLASEFQLQPALAQFSRLKVNFEGGKA